MTSNELTIDSIVRSEVIDTLLSKLRENYVFPKVAEEMEEAMRRRLSNGEYDTIDGGEGLAEILTAHIQEVSHDKHLRVMYSAEELPIHEDEGEDPERDERWREIGTMYNFGFVKVERLPGNIGYLEFHAFFSPEFGGDVAVAAMNFLANTSALIVDLRKNHGGDPAMIALICSYFFGSEPVHLNSLYWRASDSTQQFWTLPYVPGKRYGDKPVYVLTSHETFSGAEEFTYNLKNLKRATIIGETTGGGAHPGDRYRISSHFEVFIPTGRAISPITGTNWEGTGVTPDVEVSQEEALKTAQVMALKKVVEQIGDKPSEAQRGLMKEAKKTLDELQGPRTPTNKNGTI